MRCERHRGGCGVGGGEATGDVCGVVGGAVTGGGGGVTIVGFS